MTDNLPENETKKKRMTNAELLSADPIKDDLSTEEMTRREVLLKNIEAQLNAQDLKDRVDERKNKKEEIRERYTSRGRELKKTELDMKKHQDLCSHRKAGRGIEALQKGGNAADFAVIRHILPTNEMWQRCLRCGKTWRPPHSQDFDLSTDAGKAAYDEAKRIYKEAISWPTDNQTSSGITFNWNDAGEFAHVIMKDTNLR